MGKMNRGREEGGGGPGDQRGELWLRYLKEGSAEKRILPCFSWGAGGEGEEGGGEEGGGKEGGGKEWGQAKEEGFHDCCAGRSAVRMQMLCHEGRRICVKNSFIVEV